MKIIPFKSFLVEIFQQHYPYTTEKIHGRNYDDHYFTTEKGHKYKVEIGNGKTPSHEVAFAQVSSDGISRHVKTKMTHNEGHHAAKVFSTVHHILKHHVANNPHITHLHFTSSNSEPKRTILYHHMAKKISPNYKHASDSFETQFSIPLREK